MKTLIKNKLKKSDFLKRGLLRWERKNFAEYPWRHTSNKWHCLVAEIMLQRTNAEQVIPAYSCFAKNYPTPEKYIQKCKKNIFQGLGLLWRNKKLKELTKRLKGRSVPEDKTNLIKLPAVGNYVAGAFRSLHLNIRDVIIDSNIVRFYGRFFGFRTHGETRRQKWLIELSQYLTPKKNHRLFNYGLLDFTRTICKVSPLCKKCFLRKKCDYYLKKSSVKYP